jgi:polysaccharide biosynthesis/export protein
MRRRTPAIIAFAALLGLTGCASHSKGPGANAKLNQWLIEQDQSLPPLIYQVQPPDKLAIVAPKIKELDGQVQAIRPDGRISLNLLGEVEVAGKTPEQIGAELRALASKYYAREMLDISVRVEEFASQVVYVFGQVEQPGIKPYTGRDTIVTVLAAAQLNNNAWPQKIVIVRPNEDVNVRQKVTVDLKEMYQTGETSQNFLLEPGGPDLCPAQPAGAAQHQF